MPELSHFIDGVRVQGKSGQFRAIPNPATGEILFQCPLANATETRAAIDSAATAQVQWAATNPQKRGRVMMAMVALIHREMEMLAATLSREHGKTLPDAKGDIQRGLEVLEYCIGAPQMLKGEYNDNVGPGIDLYAMRQPLGVVAAIMPFNFPAMMPLWHVGPALACGNAVILKPSEIVPSVPLRLAELFIEAGLPKGLFQVVNGDKQAVDILLDSPTIQAVSFVGSTKVAAQVYARATAAGKRAQCFGGAKNHMIIMPDADMDQAADALVGAGYGAAGERCMAISVAVPVGKDTAERLLDKLVPRIHALKIGPYTDKTADMGPVISAEAKIRIEGLIQSGLDQGAKLVVDQRGFELADNRGGFFLGPHLFDHVTPAMEIYRAEIFGPVLSMVRTDHYEQALGLATDHIYGNGVAIFTRDGGIARDFVHRVDVGMVGVNVPIPVPLAYHSFGGWKKSIFGDLNQHGPDSFRFYTRTKTVTSRWPAPKDRDMGLYFKAMD